MLRLPTCDARAFTALVVAGMLVAGTTNTLLFKWQDEQCVDAECTKYFAQPVWQTLFIEIGQSVWLLIYFLSRRRGVSNEQKPLLSDNDDDDDVSEHTGDTVIAVQDAPECTQQHKRQLTGWLNALLAIPSLCDLTGTTLQNIGLSLIAASIYQMLGGVMCALELY